VQGANGLVPRLGVPATLTFESFEFGAIKLVRAVCDMLREFGGAELPVWFGVCDNSHEVQIVGDRVGERRHMRGRAGGPHAKPGGRKDAQHIFDSFGYGEAEQIVDGREYDRRASYRAATDHDLVRFDVSFAAAVRCELREMHAAHGMVGDRDLAGVRLRYKAKRADHRRRVLIARR